ncbi:effector-associated constant component EACC1 [Nocardia sp. CA-107356]|uniref:effector-associated constant component EACC1 n=1 Tax=Nocardia sp. CA-107356 TaxID=3239972 RepID=UPI003D8A85C2
MTSLRLCIRMPDAPESLRSLLEWLRAEDELRGRVSLESVFDQTGHEMGGVVDMLAVALSSGGAGAALAGSLSTWLTHRRSDVKITVTGTNGRSIELDARRVPDVSALVRDIDRLVDTAERSGEEIP